MEQGNILSPGQPGLSAEEVVRRLATQGEPGRRTAPRGPDGPAGAGLADAGLADAGLADAGLAERRRGDHDLNPEFYEPGRELTTAAVLVPIVTHADGLTVLFTRRTDHLHDHAGQISFPGGRIEAGDADAAAAALRETEEEIGLPRRHVTLAGRLDTYVTRTGFEITPLVGLVAPPFPLRLDSFEVAEAFEVPLDFLLDPDNRETHSRMLLGAERSFFAYSYRDYYIWGVTAGMVANLAEVLIPKTFGMSRP